MLQFMRQRASSWIIKGILSIIVLAFIFMGVGNFRNQNNVTAATVNGDEISVTEFNDRYYVLLDSARQQFGNQLNDEILKMLNLKEQALDQLIMETLMLQKAVSLGFQVSDQELSDTIRGMSVFQRNGSFSPDLYNSILKRNRLTPESFEQLQKKEMLLQKVKQLIDDSVKVSEDEARTWYDWQQAEVKIKAALFKPGDFSQITPSEDALKEYFEEHKEEYRTSEKTQITYIRFNPEEFTSQVTVSDDEMLQYYNDHRDDFRTDKTVEVSHILIKVAANAPEATVSAKEAEAMKIFDMVTSGEQDFAAVAKQYSEDAGSAFKGGSLGKFKKDELVAPFAEKAFSMEQNEISRPVRTSFGWHIIKVDKINEASVTPLPVAKVEIQKTLALEKARELAYEEALNVFDAAIDKGSVEQAAEQFKRDAETTPLFSRTDSLEGVPASGDLISQTFDLLEDEISDVVEAGGSYYLFQVVQRVAPEVPDLAAVRDAVLEDLSTQMRDTAAKEAAEAFLAAVEDGKSMEAAAENTPAEIITSDYFKRQAPIPEIGNEAELSREAFLLTPEKPLADNVITGSKGYYVIYLEDRRLPEQASFAAEKDKVMTQLLQVKKQDVFSEWLSAMKAESEIKRNERILN